MSATRSARRFPPTAFSSRITAFASSFESVAGSGPRSSTKRSSVSGLCVESTQSTETLVRFAELRSALPDVLDKEQAKAVVRELKAVGGNLRALRVALTGAERGPELWAVVAALPRDEALRRALP